MPGKKSPAHADISQISAAAVRQFLQQSADSESWSLARLAQALGITAAQAQAVAAAMQMSGYIESHRGAFRNTEAGNAVAKVSKAKPVKRATAEKALQDFLKRAQTVNLEKQYLYSVERIALSGPFLTRPETVRSVDIAVELIPKIRSAAKLAQSEKQQAEEAEASGKHFKSFADRRAWSRNKALAFLKGKTRALSVRAWDEQILNGPHKLLTLERPMTGH